MKQTLHIISGPTAVGKTEFALRYAEDLGAEIVSCDASLVYRGMDIGSAKPSRDELSRVPHHLIDIQAVRVPYDIVAYVRDAQVAVEAIADRGKAIVVTGGSSFYLKSFFAPVIDLIEVPERVRRRVALLWEREGLDGLLRLLHEVSRSGTGNLDTKNPRRVIRALERSLASGKDLAVIQAEFAARPLPYADFEKRFILLERDKKALEERVARRAETMLRDGLIEEVERLLEEGIMENPSAASAIGYRETIAYLKGELGREALLPTIIQNTLHLVKKQRTWFRTQLPKPDVTHLLGVGD